MYTGKTFSFKEVAFWTRRDVVSLLVIASVPVLFYKLLGWTWLAIPWMPIALLGTAVAFVIGFSNNASYDRLWEGRGAWGGIVSASRTWALLIRDYITNDHTTEAVSDAELLEIHRTLYRRHFAWLAVLRFQLREPRRWEAVYEKNNAEFKERFYSIAEQEGDLEKELLKYLPEDEVHFILSKNNRAVQLLSQQSLHLKELLRKGFMEDFRFMEMERTIAEFYRQQGVSEKLKNFPYPRQYATVNLYFTRIFTFLLPLGMLQEFDRLGPEMAWLSIPLSALATWVFSTMQKIGKTSENPFEGSVNDIPITTLSRTIEIDMLEMLNESSIPRPLRSVNNVLS